MYKVKADTTKNRLIIMLDGTIESSEVTVYKTEVKKAVSMLKPGFTALLDLRKASIFTQSTVKLDSFIETKKIAVEGGLHKSAMVVESATLKMQITRMFRDVGAKDEAFTTIEDAEKFLSTM